MDVTIPCICPPKADGEPRHDSDTVTLRDVLDFRTTLTLRQTVRWMKTVGDPSEAEILAALTEAYLLHCIESWTLVDEKGRPVEPSRPEVVGRLLAHVDEATIVADAADALYSEKVLLPLVIGSATSSRPTPTAASTSVRNGSSPTHQKPSKRSSTTTSPMAATEPTLMSAGSVSGSSPNLASAR